MRVRLTRIGRQLMVAVLAVLAAACQEQTKETAILLTVKTDMGVDSEMDTLTLEVVDPVSGMTKSGVDHVPPDFVVDPEHRSLRVAWRVAVVTDSIAKYPDGVELVVKGLKDDAVVSSTGAFKEFRQDEVVRQTVNLKLGEHAPLIVSTVPGDGDEDVDTGTVISVTFNQAMTTGPAVKPDVGIEDMAEFHDRDGNTVEGELSSSPDFITFTFTPSAALEPDTEYSAMLRARNASGEAFLKSADTGEPMARSYALSFATGSFLEIESTEPADGATGVAQDRVISVTFEDDALGNDVVAATVNASSVLLTDDLGAVAGSVTYDEGSRTARFTPSQPLRELIEHTAAVTTDVQTSDGTTLASDYLFHFTTTSDPPAVVSTRPADQAADVALNAVVAVTFDEAMAATGLDTAFTVRQDGGSPLDGSVSYDTGSFTATFTPDTLLEAGASVSVTVSGDVTDASGIPMGSDYAFDFTVGDGPGVVATDPPNGATGVDLMAGISASFTRDMNAASLNNGTFRVDCDGAVAGSVSYQAGSRTATFSPSSALPEYRNCEVVLTTGVQDASGVPLLAEYRWTFQTAGMPPAVVATDPPNGASEVSTKSRTVTVEFSEPLDPARVNATNFRVSNRGGSVAGDPVWVGGEHNAVTLTFPGDLLPGQLYLIEVGGGVTDTAGLAMAAPYLGVFYTREAPAIAYTLPETLSVDVATNSLVVAGFNVPMDPETFVLTTNPDLPDSVTVLRDDLVIEGGTLTYYAAPRAMVFRPQVNLAPHTRYTVVLDGSKIADDEGTLLGGVWSFGFVTGGGQDGEAPFVVETEPANQAGDVELDAAVFVTFSEAMEPLTITAANITLAPSSGGAAVDATVRYLGSNTAMLLPDAPLDPGKVYLLTVSDRVRDASGNQLEAEVQVLFTTEDPDTQPPQLGGTMPDIGAVDVPTNQSVALLFDEPVDGATAVVTALAGTTPVSGTVRTALYNRVVMFVPDGGWPAGKHVTVFVAAGLADLQGNAIEDELTACYFDVGSAPDTERPRIVSSLPANDATQVAANTFVVLNLSEQLDLGSFDLYQIEVKQRSSGARVPYVAGYDPGGPRLELLLSGALSGGKAYDVVIPAAARDLAGNTMQEGAGLNRIGFTVDSLPPQVAEVSPPAGGVLSPGGTLVARFSEPVDPATLDMVAFHLRPKDGGFEDDFIPGAVAYSAATRTAVLMPSFTLTPGEQYDAWILDRVTDLAGNPLQGNQADGFTWRFNVASSGLWIVDVDPGPGDLLQIDEFDKDVRVTFNVPVKPESLEGNVWVENQGGAHVDGEVHYESAGQTAVFSLPDGVSWESGEAYTIHVDPEVQAVGGDYLETPYTSGFSTVTILFSDGMEDGDDGWFAPVLSQNTWRIERDETLEPGTQNVWATRERKDGSKVYKRPCNIVLPLDDKITLSSPEIEIPGNLTTVYLVMLHRYHIEDSDFATLEVNKSGLAQPRAVLAPFNGNNNQYEWLYADISSLVTGADAGGESTTVRLEFTLQVDGQRPRAGGQCDPTYIGWQFDNVVVFGY